MQCAHGEMKKRINNLAKWRRKMKEIINRHQPKYGSEEMAESQISIM
jgi:hypothetical protein